MVVAQPALLNYRTEAEYLDYYRREYCRKGVVTCDGIRVYFKEDRFAHAFYESSNKTFAFLGVSPCNLDKWRYHYGHNVNIQIGGKR